MQEKEVPVISVLMPVYNAAETLNAAVDSIRKQDYPDWELIAVDDGSTDSSGEILKHLARQDPRIHVHSISHGGIVAALQAAAAHAGGAYLARMDADDLARPERLRLQLDCFAADRALSICGGRVSMMGESIGFGRRRYEDWVNTLVSHDASPPKCIR